MTLNSIDKLITVPQAFYHWEATTPDAVFLRQPFGDQWREYRWKEVADQVRRVASHLKTLPPNSHIAIMSLNCAHWFMADLAIMLAGHISVPIYPTAGKDTIKTILEHSDSRMLLVGKLPDWDEKKTSVPEGIGCMSFHTRHEDMAHWDDIVEVNEPLRESPTRSLDELATLIYTSGTTGMPKGVMIDYRALANAAAAGQQYAGLEKERFFSYLPLAHCAERALTECLATYTGSCVSFTESLDKFQKNLVESESTVFFGVPRIWLKFQQGAEAKVGKSKLRLLLSLPIIKGIVAAKIRKQLGLEGLKITISGAAAIPKATIHWFEKVGLQICEGYGLSETMAFSHINVPERRRVGTVGLPLPTAEVKISDAGEILLKSPCVMKGYYKEPKKTADTMDNGWVKTGDLGAIDQDGFLSITGRVKDIFKTSKGKYVSPLPIEAKLEPELDVEHLCVIGNGLPTPMAIASVERAALGDLKTCQKEIEITLDKLNNQLEKHEKLSKIVLVEEAWTTDNGLITPTLKIRRQQIEDHYAKLIAKYESATDKVILNFK